MIQWTLKSVITYIRMSNVNHLFYIIWKILQNFDEINYEVLNPWTSNVVIDVPYKPWFVFSNLILSESDLKYFQIEDVHINDSWQADINIWWSISPVSAQGKAYLKEALIISFI